MKLLLDTHIWLWFLRGDGQLSGSLRSVIENPDASLWLSPISVWETLLLAERKRIYCPPEPVTWVRLALKSLPVQEAPLTTNIAIRSRALATAHADPADRFIAATALEMGLTLATVDQQLLAIPGLKVLS